MDKVCSALLPEFFGRLVYLGDSLENKQEPDR